MSDSVRRRWLERWDSLLAGPRSHRRSSRDAAQGILFGALLGALAWGAMAGWLWWFVRG